MLKILSCNTQNCCRLDTHRPTQHLRHGKSPGAFTSRRFPHHLGTRWIFPAEVAPLAKNWFNITSIRDPSPTLRELPSLSLTVVVETKIPSSPQRDGPTPVASPMLVGLFCSFAYLEGEALTRHRPYLPASLHSCAPWTYTETFPSLISKQGI